MKQLIIFSIFISYFMQTALAMDGSEKPASATSNSAKKSGDAEIFSLFDFEELTAPKSKSSDSDSEPMDDGCDMFSFLACEDTTGDTSNSAKDSSKTGCNIPASFKAPASGLAIETKRLAPLTDLESRKLIEDIRLEIDRNAFCLLAVKSGRGQIYVKQDRVLKLCDGTREAEIIHQLQSRFPFMLEIFRTSILYKPSNFCGIKVFAIIEMKKGKETFRDWIQGKSITSRIEGFIKVCEAIKALHRLGYMHGDLKPENIIVDDDRFLLIDFDQCREIGESAGNDNGTPYYCNYQISKRQASGRIDIFSLGLIFYELFYPEKFFSNFDDKPISSIEFAYPVFAKFDNASVEAIKERLNRSVSAKANNTIIYILSDHKIDKVIAKTKELIQQYDK